MSVTMKQDRNPHRYSSCRACVCVCVYVYVCMCVIVCVCVVFDVLLAIVTHSTSFN